MPAAPMAAPPEDDASPEEVVAALPGDAPPPVPPPEITEVSPFERRLTVLIDPPAWDRARNAAARRLSRGLNIKGFRRGKAPRRLVENAVGEDRVREEALEIALPALVGPALQAAQLVPAVAPWAEDIRETEQGVEADILISLWPVLDEPPAYEGRRFQVEDFAVTDEMVEANVERYLDQYAELETVDRPAEEGDYAAINLHGSRDGRPVEAASAADLLYEVGSGSLLEGLDANLIGRSAGDIGQFATILPPEMTGGRQEDPVDVSVMIKEVRRKKLPQVDDRWLADNTEFESEEEMRQDIVHDLEMMRLEEMRRRLKQAALDGLVEEAKLEIPAAILHAHANRMINEMGRSLEQADRTWDDYLQSTGETQEQFQDRILLQTYVSLARTVVLEAVARQTGVTVGDDEKMEFYRRLAPQVRETPDALAARLQGTDQERSILNDMIRSKAHEELARRVTAVDEDDNPLDIPWPSAPPAAPPPETD